MLARNTLVYSATLVSGYVFSLLLAPLMLAQLGLVAFGVWAVTGAFAVYAGLMDLGVSRAMGRFVALYHARGDRRSVEECFTLGLIVVSVVAAVAAGALALAAPLITHALDDPLSTADMRIVLLAVAGIFFLQTYRAVMSAVPEGMQRFAAPSAATATGNFVNFAFSVAALLISPDLVTYALANLAAEVVGIGLTFAALRHVWSPVRVRWPRRPLVKEVLGFSLKSQGSWVADLVNLQADKVIIALLIDVRAAAAVEVGSRVVTAVKAVGILSVSAMVPKATADIATGGTAIVADFYRRYTRLSLSLSLPVMLFTCASAPALMTAWLGDVPEYAVAVLVVLTLANCVNLSTGVATSLALGDGRAGMIAVTSAITAGLNIAATLVLTPFFGLWGVIAGTAIGIVGGSLVYLAYFHRLYRIPPRDYLRPVATPFLVAALPAVPIALWFVISGVPGGPGERVPNLVFCAIAGVLYLGCYWLAASRLDVLPRQLVLPGLRRPASVGA